MLVAKRLTVTRPLSGGGVQSSRVNGYVPDNISRFFMPYVENIEDAIEGRELANRDFSFCGKCAR